MTAALRDVALLSHIPSTIDLVQSKTLIKLLHLQVSDITREKS